MPARKEEVEHAMEEGIIFKTLNNPVEILGNEHKFVTGMKCVEMELGEPDASGRRRPVEKPDSEFVLDVDCVVMSIGTSPNPLIRNTTKGLDTNKHGCFIADENGQTSREGVFAGGDAVNRRCYRNLAMGAARLRLRLWTSTSRARIVLNGQALPGQPVFLIRNYDSEFGINERASRGDFK